MQTRSGHKKGFTVVAIATIAAILAIFWLGDTKTEDTAALRIATNPWPGYEFLHLASVKGFFKEEGAPIKLVRFSTLEDSRRAYERGQVDGMAATPIEMIQANDAGYPSQVVLITDAASGADVIIARKGINSVKELKGKKVAVEPPFGVYATFNALQKAGLSLGDIKVVNMNQLKMSAALLSGRVDAIHTYAPYSTEVLRHPDKIGKVFRVPGDILDLVVMDPDIVAQRPDDIRALRRAWDKTVAYAQEHPAEANKIMGELENISPQEFSKALKEIKIFNHEEQRQLLQSGALREAILKTGTVLRKTGQIKAPPSPDNFIADIKDAPWPQ